MHIQEDKKAECSLVVTHWTNKFETAIRKLLKSGIKSNELIEKIKAIENETNN